MTAGRAFDRRRDDRLLPVQLRRHIVRADLESMIQPDHNKVLKAVAKEVLAPLGLVQKGRSRTWLDDRGWYLIVVDFMPSGWSKGSYLNVAATWLWHPTKDYISFDYMHVAPQEWESADQDWPRAVRRLAVLAERRVLALRTELFDLPAAAEVLRRDARGKPGWPAFNAAIALGLVGRARDAQRLARAVLESDDDRAWWLDAQARMRELSELLLDTTAFRRRIAANITDARALLKLPAIDADAELRDAGAN